MSPRYFSFVYLSDRNVKSRNEQKREKWQIGNQKNMSTMNVKNIRLFNKQRQKQETNLSSSNVSLCKNYETC